MWQLAISVLLIVLVLLYFFYEFRIRKPDQFILYEDSDRIRTRKARLYPRHFSLAVPRQAQSKTLRFEAEAKGRLAIEIKTIFNAAPSPENLDALIRSGGWSSKAVDASMEQASIVIEALCRDLCERHDVEQLYSEKLNRHVLENARMPLQKLGLDLLSVNTQSIEPVDEEIVLAMQKREEARIKERTEKDEQKTRIAMARARMEADEKIWQEEQALALKKLQMQQEQDKQESKLADQRVRDEIARKKLHLQHEKEEMALLKNHPELLVLSPQLTQLARASQNMPNAKTVVSLGQDKNNPGGDLLFTIQNLIRNLINTSPESSEK